MITAIVEIFNAAEVVAVEVGGEGHVDEGAEPLEIGVGPGVVRAPVRHRGKERGADCGGQIGAGGAFGEIKHHGVRMRLEDEAHVAEVPDAHLPLRNGGSLNLRHDAVRRPHAVSADGADKGEKFIVRAVGRAVVIDGNGVIEEAESGFAHGIKAVAPMVGARSSLYAN